MKELSIEEKAKRYDEAIERAKDFMNGEVHYALRRGENIMCWIFPELRDSEDEWIRKNIISWLKNIEGQTIPINDYNSAIAWLEKQGEQNHTDKVEPKFKVGDIIYKPSNSSCPVHSSIDGTLCTVIEVLDKHYILDTNEGRIQESFAWQDYYELVKQKPAWSEEDDQYLLVCKNALAKYQTTDKWDAGIISHWLEDKLKSIRPQNTWKPSDEQIADLWNMVCECRPADQQLLQDIYYGLKTLKGE